jgi:hypothetical protein
VSIASFHLEIYLFKDIKPEVLPLSVFSRLILHSFFSLVKESTAFAAPSL